MPLSSDSHAEVDGRVRGKSSVGADCESARQRSSERRAKSRQRISSRRINGDSVDRDTSCSHAQKHMRVRVRSLALRRAIVTLSVNDLATRRRPRSVLSFALPCFFAFPVPRLAGSFLISEVQKRVGRPILSAGVEGHRRRAVNGGSVRGTASARRLPC